VLRQAPPGAAPQRARRREGAPHRCCAAFCVLNEATKGKESREERVSNAQR